jgi:hypothetical protein
MIFASGIDLAVLSRWLRAEIAGMLKTLKARPARQIAKWCAYGLALAVPGSLVVLPLWLLRRHWASRAAWLARPPHRPGSTRRQP